MQDALRGVQTLFLVSAREASDRMHHHRSAVDAAREAGVGRIVYLSILNAAPDATFTLAREHFHTEQHILSTGIHHTFLRDGLYLDYLPMLVGEDGVIRGPAGEGRAALIARDDVVNVAVSVLLSNEHDGKTYDVTGREALTMAEAAALLSHVTGRTITFLNETVAEARESRGGYGAPDWQVDAWVSTYLAIARGEMGPESDIVFRLTGRQAQTLSENVRAHPEAYRHLVTRDPE
jgi:NAD(P)H dehydrogenase (quinone)